MKLTVLDEKMSIRIEAELKDQVIAIGYTWGFEGSYSDTIRFILRSYLPKIIEGLPKEKQEEYNKTLEQLILMRDQKIAMLTQPLIKENSNDRPHAEPNG